MIDIIEKYYYWIGMFSFYIIYKHHNLVSDDLIFLISSVMGFLIFDFFIICINEIKKLNKGNGK